MERSLKTSSDKETIRALFATKKAVDSENNLNLMNQENALDQGSLDYDSDRMNESEREECDDMDESLRKSTKWTDGTVISLMIFFLNFILNIINHCGFNNFFISVEL